MTEYIATAQFDDTISNFGRGGSCEAAMDDFTTDAFACHCERGEIVEGEAVLIRVFKAILPESAEWDEDSFDPGWQWALGEKVHETTLEALP